MPAPCVHLCSALGAVCGGGGGDRVSCALLDGRSHMPACFSEDGGEAHNKPGGGEAYTYGWSLLYTRAAWLERPFVDASCIHTAARTPGLALPPFLLTRLLFEPSCG